MDQIANQTAKVKYMFGGKAKVPVTIRTQGGTGRSSAAQHAQSLEAWFLHVPGLKVVMPSNPFDVKGLLKSAIRDDNPDIFIENKTLHAMKGQVPEGTEHLIPLGKADLKRQGSDVTVVAVSRLVNEALRAAADLEKDGVSVEVVDLMTVQPWDREAVFNSVGKTHRLVIAHEAAKQFGIGAEIAASVAEEILDELDAPVMRVGAPFVPIHYSLEKAYVPGVEDVKKAIRATLQRA
jgi:pyruvate dehydrogenase E1 component beta subunit